MTIKVLSYNIREGGNGRLREIAEVVQGQRPDAAALLEANSRANAEALADDLGMELVFGEANCPYHVAWLSRLPIRRWKNHRLPALAKTLLEIEVAWEETPLRLFATHLGSRHDLPQPVDEVPVILDVLRPLASQPHLLVGDFNALRPGDPIGIPPHGVTKQGDAEDGALRPAIQFLVDAGYTDCFRVMHPQEPGYTYPAESPWLRLDYAFASPSLAARLVGCDAVTGEGAVRASDHLPIWVAFAPAERASGVPDI